MHDSNDINTPFYASGKHAVLKVSGEEDEETVNTCQKLDSCASCAGAGSECTWLGTCVKRNKYDKTNKWSRLGKCAHLLGRNFLKVV